MPANFRKNDKIKPLLTQNTMQNSNLLTVIGGGLAGCEAAWQAAIRDIKVELYEMRPEVNTGAHSTANLAELVCTNSLGSNLVDRASGLLKEELRVLNSLLVSCADKSKVPAGGALAIDRELFSNLVMERIYAHPNITVIRREIENIPDKPVIIASGPLTSPKLSQNLKIMFGQKYLYFYDAIAPIVTYDSINMDIAFRASRYNRNSGNDGDYINCPFDETQYKNFVLELIQAERINLKPFESEINNGVESSEKNYFESCLPVEIIAERGEKALAFGPMRPIGLINPHTKRRAHAILQLRQDNLNGTLYNLVGFQTNLTYKEQNRIFRTIPGLENAEFVRYGQMHRNTYLNAPQLLLDTLQYKKRMDIFVAGQITGVEGYVGSIATGLIAGINAARYLQREALYPLPHETMLGALINYITKADADHFQPMKANFGILPSLENEIKSKQERAKAYSSRSLQVMDGFSKSIQW